jgi:hypothetical protein
MDTLRLIPRTGTEEILLAVLRELESIHADLERLVGVDATPQPVAEKPAAAKTPAPRKRQVKKKS